MSPPICYIEDERDKKLKQDVFMKHYAPAATKSKTLIFRIEVTMSSTMVPIERVSLLQHACKIQNVSFEFKSYYGKC